MKKLLLFTIILLYCFNISAQNWYQIGADIDGIGLDDKSGASVSMSADGQTIAIGSPFNDNIGNRVGIVNLFTYDGENWNQKGNTINGISTEMGFGYTVSLSDNGNRVAICASLGKIRIYDWNGVSWEQLGNSLDREIVSTYLGPVALSGNGEIVAVGDLGNTTNGLNAGQVRLYTLNENIWQQKGSSINGTTNGKTGNVLDINYDGNTFATNLQKDIQVYYWNVTDWALKGNANNVFPAEKVNLSSDGNIMAISGFNVIGQTDNKGIAQVYLWNGSSWDAQGDTIQGEQAHSYFGFSLSISKNGQVLAVGTPYGNTLIGEVKTYVQIGSNWEQIGNTLLGQFNDYLGYSISLNANGNILGVGIPNSIDNQYGLMDKSRVFRNDEVLGISDIAKNSPLNLNIYPNPSNGNFTIDLGKECTDITVQISNMLGQIISTEKFVSAKEIKQEINFSSGVYFVKINTAKEGSNTLRIIKQ